MTPTGGVQAAPTRRTCAASGQGRTAHWELSWGGCPVLPAPPVGPMPRKVGTTTQRGYDYKHKRGRKAALAAMRDGDPCTRCGHAMHKGDDLHYDHDDDRTTYRGLAHASCNERAGA